MTVLALILVGLVAVVLAVAGPIGLLVVVWSVLAWVWFLDPVPMTLLYLGMLSGFGAMLVYPRYRPGVVWSEIVTGRVADRAPVSDPRGDDVAGYLARVRDEHDRAA